MLDSLSMATERIIEINQHKIWTESLGDPSNPAIIFLSGAGAHAHFWIDAFCQYFLDAGFFLIRFDYRDVGLSSGTDEDYEIDTLISDVIGILNGYGLSSAHIVGHSMGGYLAQLLAVEFPGRISTITIISAGPAGETPELNEPYTAEEKWMLNETWRVMLRNRPTQDFDESLEGFMDVWKRLNGTLPLDEELAKEYTQELFTRSNFPVGVHNKHVKVMQKVAETMKERSDIFSKIKVPTLIIHGAEDYLVLSKRGGEALAKAIPNAKFELIPKMGHMIFNHEMQKLISEKIIGFLSQFQ